MRAAIVALALVLLPFEVVSAHHADVVRSQPAAGAWLAAPTEVRAWFNLPLVVPGSGLAVVGSDARRVDDNRPRLDADDSHALSVRVSDVLPGEYRVTWRVTAETDLDYAEGSYTFQVTGQPGLTDRLRSYGLLALGLAILFWGVLRGPAPAARE